ncbi:FUSC family protein [Rudaeicoccus suwonensis]|uniref:Putative membrane protein YccC n=1 Tax=Rudaeicoccus suwonensis TaxID=657409 RepID=A0A561E1E4_9MICO|nr:FUSC family protein [Rudaeicoccus suwonensis]TWE09448.1 putative membrane protein YccC [Rudaeicoccus suwonensis]
MPSAIPSALSRQVMTFAEVKPAPGRWKFALHATAITAVAVALISLILGPALALVGLLGAFLGVVASNRPIRNRLVILSAMDATYIVGTALGTLVGESPVLLTMLLCTIAVITVLGYNTLVGEPPGAMFLIIGPAIATYLPSVGMARGSIIAVAAIGCIGASAASLLLQLLTPRQAEQDAMDGARQAVTEYLDTDVETTPLSRRAALRDNAYANVFAASMILEDAVGREPRLHRWRQMNSELRRLHVAIVERIVRIHLLGSTVAVSGMEQRRYLGRPDATYLVRWGLSTASLPWLAARRIGAAVLLTCVVSYGFHIGHPYWSVMTAALIMSMQADRLSLTHRALHRLAGTVVGIGVFAAVHSLHLSGIIVVLITLVLVFFIQLLAVRNYAIAVIFVTPMALLISTASSPYKPIGTIVGQRFLETLIGAAASLLVIWIMGRRTPIALVRRQFRRTLRSLERLLLLLSDGQQSTDSGYAARRDLAFEKLQCGRILQIAQSDLPGELADGDELETALNELTYVVLAACWTTDPVTALDAHAMAQRLQRLLAHLPPVGTTPVDATGIADALRVLLRVGKRLNIE